MQERIDTMNIQAQNTDLNNLPIAEPVQPQERIEVLDVIRGFALLGILIANMAIFSSPAPYLEILGKNMWTGFWDTITSSFINLLIQGKFYSMFSFLFGLGFAIFFERAKAKTTRPILLFYRRLFILLLIGLAHAFFIWFGDILVTYALLGFLLPLFFNRKPKTILIWAVALFSVFILFMALAMGLLALAKMIDAGAVPDMMQPLIANMESRIESSFHAYGQGTFTEIMAQRTSDTLFGYSNLFAVIFIIFPLFLLGLYAGKRAIFQNIEANLTLIRKIWKWSLVIGLSMSIVKFICKNLMGADFYSFYSVFHMGAGFLGDTGLCLFFMTSIVRLYQNKKWMLRFKPLAYMGRMPLSNYLFQSIVCTTIFYSYGLGLYGKVGPALGLVLTIAIFTIQIFISKYWLKRYQFGPMEWVWRSLTYGKFYKNKGKTKNTAA
jgi:uncharacterized protein